MIERQLSVEHAHYVVVVVDDVGRHDVAAVVMWIYIAVESAARCLKNCLPTAVMADDVFGCVVKHIDGDNWRGGVAGIAVRDVRNGAQ